MKMSVRICLTALLCLTAVHVCVSRRACPEFEIKLDDPPETRFAPLIAGGFNVTVWKFFNTYFANDTLLLDLLYELTDIRGPEPAEMQAEIHGLSDISRLPLKFVQGIQMLYELQTLMVPIENLTQTAFSPPSWLPKLSNRASWHALSRLPWKGPGCTGILAQDTDDGSVYHARNLDFSPAQVMQDLVYTGIFTRGGKEVYRAQMLAGYQCAVTGMKKGPNGFTTEVNTRYPSGEFAGGNEEMFKNMFEEKRPLNGWSIRKILETVDDYETAVHALSTTEFVATEYVIVGGVKKGTIIARNPSNVSHQLTLGKKNFHCKDDYIIITNFDFWDHDIREYFDPTGGEIGHPRRIVAQKILNKTKVLTPESLFTTIDTKGVIATDTIFQAIMNVGTGMWNVSLPACEKCP